MIITHKLTMDLAQYPGTAVVRAMQNDQNSRALEITLLENRMPWVIPRNASVLIRYSKPDGTGGEYDTVPDGQSAWQISENMLTIRLIPQVLSMPGAVRLSVALIQGQVQLSTFAVVISVDPAVAFGTNGPADILPTYSIPTEPAEDDIPKVFFGGPLPQTKDDAIMSFRYISKTRDISGYCKTKAQGNSSMSYPKKNQTVKLYADAQCTEKLKVIFKNWGPQNKFCFKANWVDLTHARNIVSARLWGDVVKSRANYENIPELLRTSPNQGTVDGFPVKVYANGVYQGRYTLNIPKDAWMANMDDELDNHCILCGENYGSACFRAEAVIDGSDWTDEIHDTVPDSIKTRWNEAIRFVMNSTDEAFVAGVGSFFDLNSLIDYYIYGVLICNNDGFGKNQLYHTYDGQKWYATVYDLDNTFGTYLGSILAADFARNQYEDYKHAGGNLLFVRLASLFVDKIKQRYEELKQGALSLTNIINRFERFTDMVSAELAVEDYAPTTADGAFTGIPLQEQSNIQQIRSYIAKRYAYVESYIMSLGERGTLLYQLPGATTFDGVDDYVNTGLALFDEPKDFTMLMDIDPSQAGAPTALLSVRGALSVLTDTPPDLNPYDGVSNWPFQNNTIVTGGQRTKIALTFSDGVAEMLHWKTVGGSLVSSGRNVFQSVTTANPLYIGSAYGDGGEPVIPWKGTVYSFEVWNYTMTAEEVAAKFI